MVRWRWQNVTLCIRCPHFRRGNFWTERKYIIFTFLHHYIRRVCKIAKIDNELRNVCLFFRPSALLSISPSVTGHEFLHFSIFLTSIKKIRILLKFDKNINNLCGMIMSCLILLGLRNVSNKCWRENQNKFCIQKLYFPKSCRFLVNVEKYGIDRQATDDVKMWRILFAYWINKATNTH